MRRWGFFRRSVSLVPLVTVEGAGGRGRGVSDVSDDGVEEVSSAMFEEA